MKEWHRNLAHLKAHTALSNTEIADELQVSRVTIQRALKNASVKSLIDELRNKKDTELIQADTERNRRMVEKAWSAMEAVLDDPDAAASAKVQAASTVLKGMGELVEKQQHEHKGVFGVIVVDEPPN